MNAAVKFLGSVHQEGESAVALTADNTPSWIHSIHMDQSHGPYAVNHISSSQPWLRTFPQRGGKEEM